MPGFGTSSQSQQTRQSSQTSPWEPAQPALNSILGSIGGQLNNYQPNATEQGALQSLTNNAQGLPNYGGTAGNLASSYLGGDPTGLLNPALSQFQQRLSPYADGQNLDPTKAPGMSNVLDTIRSDVTNSINGQFAGAGRDLSGTNQQALGRGISQGEATTLLNQYNQNVQNQLRAAGSLYDAAGQTAGAIGNSQAQGINYANAVPGLTDTPASQILAAQSAARGLPLNNLGMLENLTVPIAGLGGQSSGQGNSQGSYTASPLTQMAQGAGIFGNIFGGQFSPASNIAGIANMFG